MIVNQIYRWAQEQPGKIAVIHNNGPLGYLAFARAIEKTRQFLLAQDLSPLTVAVVVGVNVLDGWLAIMAARALGLTTIAVESLAQADALRVRGISCVLTHQHNQAALSQGADSLTGVRRMIVPEAIYDDIRQGDPPTVLSDSRPLGGHILYTSGTTGSYKKLLVEGAVEDQRNAARAQMNGFDGDTLFHALFFGLWTGIGFKTSSAAWREGGGVVIDQTHERSANFLAYPITYAQTTPETLRLIVDARDPSAGPVEGLLLRCGGGFVPESLARAAVARISKNFVVGFSSTEMANSLMQSRFETVEDLIWLRPRAEGRIEVVDEDGVECLPGVEGELRARITEGDSTGYLDDAEASARMFRGGYFYPGDMAIRREDGRIRILGRTADVINIKGVKHAVAPIEQRLQQLLPDVDEVCLFTGLSDTGVEELVVALQAKGKVDSRAVERALGAAPFFERIRIETFREFPRTTAGLAKTRRSELRRLVFDRDRADS
ncbi:MAG TPA: class I adenylate-forming enzyme family protein [Caulobacteraceae bacterium]|nr:class I adenylate-forming enzyme family protein [Caulobacteraceae bacterium]